MARYLGINLPEDLITKIAAAATFDSMKQKADHLLPDIEVFFHGGAQSFLHKGRNGRWREVSARDDLKLYEAAVARELSPDCARWLEHGGPINL